MADGYARGDIVKHNYRCYSTGSGTPLRGLLRFISKDDSAPAWRIQRIDIDGVHVDYFEWWSTREFTLAEAPLSERPEFHEDI
jgi:hypothetical protein